LDAYKNSMTQQGLGSPCKDVARLLLRFIEHPLEVWGLRTCNRFWRAFLADYFAAHTRAYLCEASTIHYVGMHEKLETVRSWMRHAEPQPMLVLTILHQRHRQLLSQHRALFKQTEPTHTQIRFVRHKICVREKELVDGHYGVGRPRKNRDGNGPDDQAWTRRKLLEQMTMLAKLMANNKEHEAHMLQLSKLQSFAAALLNHIVSYYQANGAIGRWRTIVSWEHIVAEFPEAERKAKRAIEEAERELRTVRARFELAKTQLK
jgi:hypothetical protein